MDGEKQFKVIRFSGRYPHKPRTVYEGDGITARSKFNKIKEDLRQGEVRLIYPSGKTIEVVTAPNLRSKW
jgi:hypothetical protein